MAAIQERLDGPPEHRPIRELWRKIAFTCRHGRQSLSEVKRMTRREINSFARALGENFAREAPSVHGDDE